MSIEYTYCWIIQQMYWIIQQMKFKEYSVRHWPDMDMIMKSNEWKSNQNWSNHGENISTNQYSFHRYEVYVWDEEPVQCTISLISKGRIFFTFWHCE